jgi:hypothetical protein
MRNDWKRRTFMTVTLNQRAYERAKELIDEARFVFDERDAWSEHQPSAMEEANTSASTALPNTANGIWELTARTPRIPKGTMSLPVGISRMSTRCGVLAAESRAGQY